MKKQFLFKSLLTVLLLMMGANMAWAGDFIDDATSIKITQNNAEITSSTETDGGKTILKFTSCATANKEFMMEFNFSGKTVTPGQIFGVVEFSANGYASGSHRIRQLTIGGTVYEDKNNSNAVSFTVDGNTVILFNLLESPSDTESKSMRKYYTDNVDNESFTITYAKTYFASATASTETKIKRVGLYTLGEILGLYPSLMTNNWQINDSYRLLNDASNLGINNYKTNNGNIEGSGNGLIETKNAAITTLAGCKLWLKAVDLGKIPANYRYFWFRYLQPSDAVATTDLFADMNENAVLMLSFGTGTDNPHSMTYLPTMHSRLIDFDRGMQNTTFVDSIAPGSAVTVDGKQLGKSATANWGTFSCELKSGYNSIVMPFKKIANASDVPTGITFYKVGSVSGNTITYTKITNPTADNSFSDGSDWTPVIVKAEIAGVYTFVGRDAITSWEGITYKSNTVVDSSNGLLWVGSFSNGALSGSDYTNNNNYAINDNGSGFVKKASSEAVDYYRAFLSDSRTNGKINSETLDIAVDGDNLSVTVPTHDLMVTSPENGVVKINNSDSTPTEAVSVAEGSTVQITTVPNDNYMVSTVSVTKTIGGGTVEYTGSDNSYSFTMPTENVTIAVTFKLKPVYNKTNTNYYATLNEALNTTNITDADTEIEVSENQMLTDRITWNKGHSLTITPTADITITGPANKQWFLVNTNSGSLTIGGADHKITMDGNSGNVTADVTRRENNTNIYLKNIEFTNFNLQLGSHLCSTKSSTDGSINLENITISNSSCIHADSAFFFNHRVANDKVVLKGYLNIAEGCTGIAFCAMAEYKSDTQVNGRIKVDDDNFTATHVLKINWLSKDNNNVFIEGIPVVVGVKSSFAEKFALSNGGDYSLSLIGNDLKLAKHHNVTVESHDNGTIKVGDAENNTSTTALYGSTVSFTVTPNDNFVLGTISVKDSENEDVSITVSGDTRTFTMPAKDVTISATFTPETATYNITGSNNKTDNTYNVSNGSYTIQVNDADVTKAAENVTVTINTNPSSGCRVKTVTVTDVDNGNVEVNNSSENTYTFTMPAKAVTITVEFEEITSYTNELPATADLWVRSDNSSAKNGTGNNFEIMNDQTSEKYFYSMMSFDVTAPTEGFYIESATLRLTTRVSRGDSKTGVYAIDATVNESSTDYSGVSSVIATALAAGPQASFDMKGQSNKAITDSGLDTEYQMLSAWQNEIDITTYAKSKSGSTMPLLISKMNNTGNNSSAFFSREVTDQTANTSIDNSTTLAQADLVPQLTIVYKKGAEQTYSITMPDPATTTEGSIIADKTSDLKQGETVTLTVTANADYQVESITVAYSDNAETTVPVTEGENDTYTFLTVDYDVNGLGDVMVNEVKVGNIAADRTAAAKDETVALTVTPELGYELGTLTVIDNSNAEVATTLDDNGKYAFTMPKDGVTVSATFTAMEGLPTADGYVRNGDKSATVYTNNIQIVRKDEGAQMYGYITFPLSIPEGKVVRSATLRLTAKRVKGDRKINIYALDGTTDETATYESLTDKITNKGEAIFSEYSVKGGNMDMTSNDVGTYNSIDLWQNTFDLSKHLRSLGNSITSFGLLFERVSTSTSEEIHFFTREQLPFVNTNDDASKTFTKSLKRSDLVPQLTVVYGNPVYELTIEEMTGGSVTATESAFESGASVTLTVTPEVHYQLKELKVNDTAVEATKQDDGTYTYTFTMPASSVSVSATFEEVVSSYGVYDVTNSKGYETLNDAFTALTNADTGATADTELQLNADQTLTGRLTWNKAYTLTITPTKDITIKGHANGMWFLASVDNAVLNIGSTDYSITLDGQDNAMEYSVTQAERKSKLNLTNVKFQNFDLNGKGHLVGSKAEDAVFTLKNLTFTNCKNPENGFINHIRVVNDQVILQGYLNIDTNCEGTAIYALAEYKSDTQVNGRIKVDDENFTASNVISINWASNNSEKNVMIEGITVVVGVNSTFADRFAVTDADWLLSLKGSDLKLAKPVVPTAKIGDTTYENLTSALAAVQDGETITLIADQEVSSRINIESKSVTIKGATSGVKISRAAKYTNGLLFLTKDEAAVLTLEDVTLDDGSIETTAAMIEAGNKGATTLKNVTVQNSNTTAAAVIVNKGGGKLTLNGVTFTNCTAEKAQVHAGTCNVTLAGKNTIANIYVEGEKTTIDGTAATHETAIKLTVDDGRAAGMLVKGGKKEQYELETTDTSMSLIQTDDGVEIKKETVTDEEGNTYATVADAINAVAAASEGETPEEVTMTVTNDQVVSSRVNVNSKDVTLTSDDNSTEETVIKRAENYTNGLIFLTQNATAKLTIENLVLDGQSVEASVPFIENSNGTVVLDGATFKNCVSSSSQGATVSNKTSGHLTLKDVKFVGCKMIVAGASNSPARRAASTDTSKGIVFVGTNNVKLVGNNTFDDCPTHIYVEKKNRIDGSEATHITPIKIMVDSNREAGVLVKGGHVNQYELVGIDGMELVQQGADVYMVATTGIRTINAESLAGYHKIYDMRGRRLTTITEKGVYIIDGKKVVVK